MITKQEYKILKILNEYLKTKQFLPAILSDDFFEKCPYDKKTVSSILVELKHSGLIRDTYIPHAIRTHAAEITDRGFLELRFHRDKIRDNVIITLLSGIAVELAVQLLLSLI